MSKEKAETEGAGNATYKPNIGSENCADCERFLMTGEGFERMEGSEDGPVWAVRCRDCAEEHGLPGANAKPKPGPWGYSKLGEGVWVVEDEEGAPVATTTPQDGNVGEANARLLAASPQLAEALHNLTDLCRNRNLFPGAVKAAEAALKTAGWEASA